MRQSGSARFQYKVCCTRESPAASLHRKQAAQPPLQWNASSAFGAPLRALGRGGGRLRATCARPTPPQNMFRSDSSRIRSPAGRRCESPGSTSSDPDSGRSRGVALHTKRPPPRWIGENASIRDEPSGLRDSEQAGPPFVCQPARFRLPATGNIEREAALTMLPSRVLVEAEPNTRGRASAERARNVLYSPDADKPGREKTISRS